MVSEQLCRHGYLPRGHTLIIDNAAVPLREDILEDLDISAAGYGVGIRYLPTFSPEVILSLFHRNKADYQQLNPCELIFGFIKNR